MIKFFKINIKDKLIKKPAIVCLVLSIVILFNCGFTVLTKQSSIHTAQLMADYILSLQQKNGAILDYPKEKRVNEDSNMEYALIALAATYQKTNKLKYRNGLDKGIKWLADTQVKSGKWKGSWWYVYHADKTPLKSPMGKGINNVRGVDTTCALFVYLLYLQQQLHGNHQLFKTYRKNGLMALDFLKRKSLLESGFTAGSFFLNDHNYWKADTTSYSADQGDVYLGFKAAGLLYHQKTYTIKAKWLKTNIPKQFYHSKTHRYALAIDSHKPIFSNTGFENIMSQGFLPWVLGNNKQNQQSLRWLKNRLNANYKHEFILSAALYSLGSASIYHHLDKQANDWIITKGYNKHTHQAYDSLTNKYSSVNVNAFCVMALLGFIPFT